MNSRALVQHDDNKVPLSLTKEFHNDSVSLNLQVSPFENVMKKLTILLENRNILDNPTNNINNKSQSSPIYRLEIDNTNNFDSEDPSNNFHQANVFLDSAPEYDSIHKQFSPLDDKAFHESFTSAIKEKVRQAKTVYVLDEVHKAITGNITVTPLPSIDFKDPQITKINIDLTTEAQDEIDQAAFDDQKTRKNFESTMSKETIHENVSLSNTQNYTQRNMQNEFVIEDQPCVVTFPITNFHKIMNEELPITQITNISNENQNVLIYVPCNLHSDEDEIDKVIAHSSEISCCSQRVSKRECVLPHSSTMMKICKHDKSVQTAISKISKRSVKILTDCNGFSRNDSSLSKSSHCDFVNNDNHCGKETCEELQNRFDSCKDSQMDKSEVLRNLREKVFNFNPTQEKQGDICTSEVSHKYRAAHVIADNSNISKINQRIENRNMVFQQCPKSYQYNSTYHISSEDKLAMLGGQKCSVCPNYHMYYPHSEISSSDPRRFISHTSKPHRTPIISNFLPLPKPVQHRFIPDYKLPHVIL